MNNKIIYICGTHGSGKSTLARAFIAQHGGVSQVIKINGSIVTLTMDGSAILGNYSNPCGGVDGYKDWKQIYTTVQELVSYNCPVIFFEGMVTYGKDKYLSLNSIPGYSFLFIKLNTAIPQCISNVLRRRAEKGNEKEFNPSNVYNKEKCWYSMYISLLEAGVKHCYTTDFDSALNCIDWFIKEETE